MTASVSTNPTATAPTATTPTARTAGATPRRAVRIGAATFAQDQPFALIAGPCQIESREHALACAERLAEICRRRDIGLVYKSSYDKANRSSGASARGVGLEAGLEILAEVRERIGAPVITDVHEAAHCAIAAAAVDALQIPAFLCRQTDLLLAAGALGASAINVKKGQFLAPWDMAHVAEKDRGRPATGRSCSASAARASATTPW